MSDPLKPTLTLMVKLGSIAVHASEMNDYGFNPAQHGFVHDKAAMETLLNDAEVVEWIEAMGKLAMLPVKRL